MNLFIKQKQTHRLRERIYGYQEGRVGGRDWDLHVYTTIFKIDNQQDLLYNIGNSAQYSVIT